MISFLVSDFRYYRRNSHWFSLLKPGKLLFISVSLISDVYYISFSLESEWGDQLFRPALRPRPTYPHIFLASHKYTAVLNQIVHASGQHNVVYASKTKQLTCGFRGSVGAPPVAPTGVRPLFSGQVWFPPFSEFTFSFHLLWKYNPHRRTLSTLSNFRIFLFSILSWFSWKGFSDSGWTCER